MTLLLALAAPAAAQDVYLYYNNGPGYALGAAVADVEDALTDVGADVFSSSSTTWPTNYTGVKLAIFLIPGAAFSASQSAALQTFVQGGGRLVVTGDWATPPTGYGTDNDTVNDLLADIGSTMTIVDDAVSGSGCATTSTLAVDQLTDGVSSISIASSSTVSGGTAIVDYGADTIVAAENLAGASGSRPAYDVVVSGDTNVLLAGCANATTPGYNLTLWENLYVWGVCDVDGDDVFSDTCTGGTDCDDDDSSTYPGADETCDLDDDDCDGTVDEDAIDELTVYADDDGDGYGDASDDSDACSVSSGFVADDSDCDDGDSSVHPGAVEACDSVDEDCDSVVDEDPADGSTYYLDEDGDGYGSTTDTAYACSEGSGFVTDFTDCDDGDAAVNPAGTEACNGYDDDCDSDVDEAGATGESTWYLDGDGDDYGNAAASTDACDEPSGYTDDATDCDDDDSAVYPGAVEVPYDGVDQDCDGDDVEDLDGDGEDSTAAGGTDCNDNDADVYTGASETTDGADEDCDGTVDEGTAVYDDDGDGFSEQGGDCSDSNADVSPAGVESCNAVDDDCDDVVDEDTDCSDDDGDGASEDEGDCNDGDPDVGTEATEIDGNGVDDDCDGVVDGDAFDEDGDGYHVDGDDCDDDDASVYPGAEEEPDGVDDDCDEVIDEGTTASDDDDDGWTEDEGDCWDDDPSVNPDAEETADGVDEDCDGLVDEGGAHVDDDGDGFSEESGDCDDGDAEVSPAATEVENGLDDDCDDAVDEGTEDVDGDGYSEADGDCDDGNGWIRPGLAEMCDGVDNDCDGEVDEGCGRDTGEVTSGAFDDGKSTCGCAGAGSTGWLALVGALGLLRRRRRAPFALVALPFLGACGSDVTVVAEEAVLEVTPGLQDLDQVPVGEAVDFRFQLDCTAGGSVDIASIDLLDVQGDSFELIAFPDAVGEGTPEYIDLRYTPSGEGYHLAVLTITSDASGSQVEREVRGQGVLGAASVWPTVLEFGAVDAGDDASRTLTLQNDGSMPLQLTAASSNSAAFEVEASLPVTLEVGGALGLEVVFTAPGDTAASGTLSLGLDGASVTDVVLRANDCEGGDPQAYDVDLDGFTSCAGDCDDGDASTHPSGSEVADNEDQDCDEVVDEGTSAYDDDGDGWNEDQGDCHDGDAEVSPGEDEVDGNGVDDDCDGVVDAGGEDLDLDGYSSEGGDCDDGDGTAFPGATEEADGADDDCDGAVDEHTSASDDDGDGYSEDGGDCDDTDPGTYPGAAESEDWADDDCDGSVDEGTDHADDDGDGYSEDGGDCDDADSAVSPAAYDPPQDGVDWDCDGSD